MKKKQKKIVALLLCIILCLGLSACGNSTDKIEQALQGRWILTQVADMFDMIYVFEDGTVTVLMSAYGQEAEMNTGTYEIGESTIKIAYESGEDEEVEINYTFEDDILTLSADELGTFQKEGSENNAVSTNPLVGKWYTSVIILEGDKILRDEMISSGGSLYVDLVVNEDMTYYITLGGATDSVGGTVKVTASDSGEVYYFEEAGLGGMINPDNLNELVIDGEMYGDVAFVLNKGELYSSAPNNGSSSFTNKYGTADTKCVVSGCNNTIAPSGDTNCCVSHSNNCLECGKYIDGDATYCMDCLSGAISGSSESYSNGSGCGYKYPDGSICGASTNNYDSLCDYHFEELNNTYNSYTN